MGDDIDVEEDFTFPATITNPPPCLLESPPLWPPVSRPGINSGFEEYDEEEWNMKLCALQELHRRRSSITLRENFCYVEDHEEEKMDILWEDLNEKFSRSCGKKINGEESDHDHHAAASASPGRDDDGDDRVHVCCVKTLKLSKANGGAAVSWRKASLLVLVRFLFKKSFAMHDSAGSIKKIEWS